VELPTKFGKMALSQGEARSFGPHIRPIRLLLRKLGQPIFRTLDFQLVEIPDGKVEKHSPGDIPIPGRLKQPKGSQLMTIGLEALPLVESGRSEIMLDQPEKSWTQRIISQQFEQAANRFWLTPVHELERATMGILDPECRMISDYRASPGWIVKFTGIRDPGKLDIDPPANQW
jgi:hypothetical protein